MLTKLFLVLSVSSLGLCQFQNDFFNRGGGVGGYSQSGRNLDSDFFDDPHFSFTFKKNQPAEQSAPTTAGKDDDDDDDFPSVASDVLGAFHQLHSSPGDLTRDSRRHDSSYSGLLNDEAISSSWPTEGIELSAVENNNRRFDVNDENTKDSTISTTLDQLTMEHRGLPPPPPPPLPTSTQEPQQSQVYKPQHQKSKVYKSQATFRQNQPGQQQPQSTYRKKQQSQYPSKQKLQQFQDQLRRQEEEKKKRNFEREQKLARQQELQRQQHELHQQRLRQQQQQQRKQKQQKMLRQKKQKQSAQKRQHVGQLTPDLNKVQRVIPNTIKKIFKNSGKKLLGLVLPESGGLSSFLNRQGNNDLRTTQMLGDISPAFAPTHVTVHLVAQWINTLAISFAWVGIGTMFAQPSAVTGRSMDGINNSSSDEEEGEGRKEELWESLMPDHETVAELFREIADTAANWNNHDEL